MSSQEALQWAAGQFRWEALLGALHDEADAVAAPEAVVTPDPEPAVRRTATRPVRAKRA